MENNELSKICFFCDAVLEDTWFQFSTYKYTGWNVISESHIPSCQNCFLVVHQPFGKIALGLSRGILQKSRARLKQTLQAAGKI